MAVTIPIIPPKRLATFNNAFGLLLFSLPFGYEPITNILFLVLLILCLSHFRLPHWRAALQRPEVQLSMAFFVWYLFSLCWSDDLHSGWRQIETKLSFLLAPIMIAGFALFTDAETKNRNLRLYVLGNTGAFLLALSLAAWQHWHFVPSEALAERPNFFVYERLSSSLMHPGYLGTFFGLAILGNAYLLWRSTGKVWWLTLALLLLGLFLLQARINLLALLLVSSTFILAKAWYFRKYSLLILPLLLFIAVLAALRWAPDSLKNRYLAWPHFNYDISGNDFNSATYRLAEWHCAKIGIERQPWLGYGVGDARTVLQDIYSEEEFWAGRKMAYNAHNQYLESWLSAGLPALLLLLALLVAYGYAAYQKKRLWLVLSLVFFAICLLTESMLERAMGVILLNIFFPYFTTQGLLGPNQYHKKHRVEKAEKE